MSGMKNEECRMKNIIEEKSFEFAVSIVKKMRDVRQKHREYDLTGQLVRSATSIGANVAEAQKGYSKKEFTAKMSISLKEANEACYWLRLMTSTGYLEAGEGMELQKQADEVVRILSSIVKSSKESKEYS